MTDLGDGYTIERELGGGGMARVYVAREHALDREVVVKVLAPDLAESLSAARFAREIRLAAALQEPHIVPVHATGVTTDGLPYYTMPFVRGESLRARMTTGAVSPAEAIAILRDVARALEYAHSRGVVHRDIKPENILLSSSTAVVTDFGIAKAITAARETTTSTLTSIGTAVGTPAYMSPEQAAGEANVDHLADIYAWGVVAWELLGERHPFADHTTARRLIAAHISEAPPPLTKGPTRLAPLVMRCLAKDPADRPQSAGELIAELDASESDAGPSTRHARKWIAAAAAMVLVIAGAAWLATRADVSAPGTAGRSVGVTTFANLSDDKENAYFSEGMTQEIADAIGRMPGVRVALHRPADGEATNDPRSLGKALNVEMVLEGTVQRAGDRVRVAARLVNSRDGFQVWTGKFDGNARDVFSLQDQVARAIAGELQVALRPRSTDSLVRVTTTNPEAHNLYMEGMYFWNRRGTKNLYRAAELFKQAVARDPKFAQAWAGIGLTYSVLVTWDDVDVDKMLDEAVAAADKALAIDSTTADAWTALGEAYGARWRYRESFVAFEKAIRLDPNSFAAHMWYGEHLAHVGRFEEGLAQVHRAQQLAPLSLVANTQEGRLELQARHFDRAKAALLHVLYLDSTYTTALTLLGNVYLQQHHPDSAITSIRKSLGFSDSQRSLELSFLGYTFATAGKPDSARTVLRELLERERQGQHVRHAGLALIYMALGDTTRALAQLDTGVVNYDPIVQMHNHEPAFDPFRANARGAAILARAEQQ